MKTGFSNLIEPQKNISHEQTMILLVVFMQNALNVAAEYTQYSGREMITPTDMIYALKYEAFNFCKRKNLQEYIEDANFELCESEISDDEEGGIEEEEIDEEFREADSDTNKFCKDVNDINHFWENWTPTDELEALLKKSVDQSIAQQLLIDSNEGSPDEEQKQREEV